MRWIRLNVSFDDSPWLFVLSAESQLAWIKLLCHVKRDGCSGRCKAMAPGVAAKRWALGEEHIAKMLKAATEDGALMVDGGDWIIVNWLRFQGDETAAERQRRFKEHRKALKESGNGGNALPGVETRENRLVTAGNAGNGTETETKKEINKERSRPTHAEVLAYMTERGLPESEAGRFVDYHDSRGWVVGRVPMKDWRAAVRTWERNHKANAPDPGIRRNNPNKGGRQH